MMEYGNTRHTGEYLRKSGFRVKKNYGQNFLTDEGVLSDIAEAADIRSTDTVLEIGPGTGNLTRLLAEKAKNVIAVEVDTELIPYLTVALEPYGNATVINTDIMKTDVREIVKEAGDDLIVVANLPYYITTPVVTMLLESGIPARSYTLMVQKEVAERMTAAPGTKDCGAISCFVSWKTEPELIRLVPAAAFYPAPKVDSAVIRLTVRKEPPVEGDVDEEKLFSIIKAAFAMRRKTVANALFAAGLCGDMTKDDIGDVLEGMGLSRTIRGERLTLADFCELTNRLGQTT